MKLTKKQKIKIIEGAIPLINTIDPNCAGICSAIKRSMNIDSGFVKQAIFELGILKTKTTGEFGAFGLYWYPMNKEGDNKRRAHLRRVLKKLKSK